MKRFFVVLLTAVIGFTAVSCGKKPAEVETSSEEVSSTAAANPEEDESVKAVKADFSEFAPEKILVVYLDCRKGVKTAAEKISEKLGCETFEIELEAPYPEDEAEMLKRADEEYESVAFPALTSSVENMTKYELVITVFPEFNGKLPMAVRSFLTDYDLRRTFVTPVCICAGETDGHALAQFGSQMVASAVVEGLIITPETDIDTVISKWLNL